MTSKSKKAKNVTESTVEQLLRKLVKDCGGFAYKFTSPGNRSVPDRMCVFPYGLVAFVECKAPGKEPTKAQLAELTKLRNLGHFSTWVSNEIEVINFIMSMKDLLAQYKNALEVERS